jgi:RNA polymerase sigma-70 factor (ECF subfamily)
MSEPHSIEGLLENATWLRALARQMLENRELADDAVQETWIAALRERPALSSERSWLARVVRNFGLQRRRSEAARRQREELAARPERLPSTAETVARAELHARLVHAVLALEEPYRSTILWRYFEGLSAEQIAARARIEPATVRSRVARAREKLRTALTERDGEPPERWLAALLPLEDASTAAGLAGAGTLTGLGGILMGAKFAVGLIAAALVAAVFVWRGLDAADPARPAGAELAAQLEERNADTSHVTSEVTGPAADVERAAVASDAAPNTPAAGADLSWRGVVLSEDGRVPLEGAHIAYRRGSEIEPGAEEAAASRTREGTRSDSAGRFALPVASHAEEGLWFEAEGHFPCKLSPGDLPRDGATPIEVLLAPLGRIELELVDDAFAPHADAPVRYSLQVSRGSQDFMWSHRREHAAGATDAAGRVSIANVPCGMPIDLRLGPRAFSTNFLGVVSIDPRERVLHHRVTLSRTATIVGRLVSEDGRPLSNLSVEWRSYPLDYGDPVRTQCDAEGAFALRELPPKHGELHVDIAGFDPRELAPGVGETLDVGALVVPRTVELSGRLTSRWLAAAELPSALSEVEVRVLRGGRVVAAPRSRDGVLPLKAGEFRAQVSDGPLELLVTRGGYFHAGLMMPREVLARIALPAPATGLSVGIDERLGVLDVSFEATEAAYAQLSLYKLAEPALQRDLPRVSSAVLSPNNTARFALLPPGRYRGTVRLEERSAADLGEFTIAAGEVLELEAPAATPCELVGSVRTPRGEPIGAAAVSWRAGSKQGTTASDAAGDFRVQGLDLGLVDIEVSHGDHGVVRRREVEVFAPVSRAEFVLAGFATLVGRVKQNGAPAPQLAIGAQPVASNDSYAATTDTEGVFRIERLPACTLRVWSSKLFVEVVELAGGETRTLEFEIGAASTVRFTRDGDEIEDLYGARAFAFDRGANGPNRWLAGELGRGGAELHLPSGRVLFEVSRARSGPNLNYLALVDDPGARVELARGALVLDSHGPWPGPLPRANLVSLEGRKVVSMWGGEIVLAVERNAEGRAIVPCLPDGARVRLSGFDSRGRRHEIVVDTPAAQPVAWP